MNKYDKTGEKNDKQCISLISAEGHNPSTHDIYKDDPH